MFKHQQLRAVVIQPALQLINLYSLPAEELLIATCAIESAGGTYLIQNGSGIAKGIYQMEPITHDDLWRQLTQHYTKLSKDILKGCGYFSQPTKDVLITNLLYATMMAQALYTIRMPTGLPKQSSIDTLWVNYKQYWNTHLGKSTKEQFFSAYYHFVGGHSPSR